MRVGENSFKDRVAAGRRILLHVRFCLRWGAHGKAMPRSNQASMNGAALGFVDFGQIGLPRTLAIWNRSS